MDGNIPHTLFRPSVARLFSFPFLPLALFDCARLRWPIHSGKNRVESSRINSTDTNKPHTGNGNEVRAMREGAV